MIRWRNTASALTAAFLFFHAHSTQAASMNDLDKALQENLKLGIRAPEFPKADWLNVGSPLTMAGLKGKVVLLDFWTYACINCMHVIPDLKKLEEKYENELVVIGVHSAKFKNERESANIRQSVLRYEIKHPVVNDAEFRIWSSYGVNAWPTLILVAPDGNVALVASGEGNYELLDAATSSLVRFYKGQLKLGKPPVKPEELPSHFLNFPGKIFAREGKIVIADSNHHRVVLADSDGGVLETIGGTEAGFEDGDYVQARFNRPQGVWRDGDILYIADTENHAVRKIDLVSKTVSTLAGTGRIGSPRPGKPAKFSSLNSPWDIVKVGNKLFIAMAGAHQIWTLDLLAGTLDIAAGNGRENIIDGPAPSAQLAQPSGLSADEEGNIYFADSEVSAVRRLGVDAQVRTLIGKGLFEFGDEDGEWDKALLQHNLGVHYADGKLYVADTYNHKIKMMDLGAGTVTTLAGGNGQLNEPGGVFADGNLLYIADTNHHELKTLDLTTQALKTFTLREELKPEETVSDTESVGLSGFTLNEQGGTLFFSIFLPKNHAFTAGAPVEYDFSASQGVTVVPSSGIVEDPKSHNTFQLHLNTAAGVPVLRGTLRVPYCTTTAPKLCKIKELKIQAKPNFAAKAPNEAGITVTIEEAGLKDGTPQAPVTRLAHRVVE